MYPEAQQGQTMYINWTAVLFSSHRHIISAVPLLRLLFTESLQQQKGWIGWNPILSLQCSPNPLSLEVSWET